MQDHQREEIKRAYVFELDTNHSQPAYTIYYKDGANQLNRIGWIENDTSGPECWGGYVVGAECECYDLMDILVEYAAELYFGRRD